MPKNISRSRAKSGLKYLRKANGQFNGSQGNSGNTKAKRTSTVKNQSGAVTSAIKIERERQRIRGELGKKQRAKLDSVTNKKVKKKDIQTPTEKQKYLDVLKKYEGRKDLSSGEAFEKKLAEVRVKQIESKERPKIDVPGKLPKKLNPQNQENNSTLLPQTEAKVKRTKVSFGGARGVEVEVKFDPTTSIELDKTFQYKVKHDGKDLVLSDNALTIKYGGEVVKGVPNIVADVKKAKNEVLVEKMALAELQTKKGNAPQWRVEEHGTIVDNPELVGKSAGVINYREMQIHHVNQWAKHPSKQIEEDFKNGVIDATERERRYLDTIEPNKSDKKTDWQLKIQPTGMREFVILAGGLHQGGTPLFRANHPQFFNPTTGKFDNIGIPESGEGSREWFNNKYRSKFWKEYAKYQLVELSREVQTRYKKGQIDHDTLTKLYTEAQAKAKKGEIQW